MQMHSALLSGGCEAKHGGWRKTFQPTFHGKFDEDTLVNMNSIKRLSTTSKRYNGFGNEYIAVEVLWTPQNENDMLSERELLEDYPLLRPL
ncbi:hypothetical protein NC651_029883 [Populus alba x Populus x berolinensis]|nr:hypothetical protein NC651_029883 [Populus alba x Populus x berolinensis]